MKSNQEDCVEVVKPSKEVEVIPKHEFNNVLNIKQSAQQLVGFVKAIKNVKDEKSLAKNALKQNAIRELGFGSFLDIDFPKNYPPFVATLVRHFDEASKCILLESDKKLEIKPIDVHLCYGLSMSGVDVEEGDDVEEDDENATTYKQFLATWRNFLGVRIGYPLLSVLVKKLFDADVEVCDNWKITFIVLAVNTMIKSTANTQPRTDFLYSCMDLNLVSQLNWFKYTFDSLVSSTAYWKGQLGRFFCGPLPFLMVCPTVFLNCSIKVHYYFMKYF